MQRQVGILKVCPCRHWVRRNEIHLNILFHFKSVCLHIFIPRFPLSFSVMLPLKTCFVLISRMSHPYWCSGLLPNRVLGPTIFLFLQAWASWSETTWHTFPQIIGIISILQTTYILSSPYKPVLDIEANLLARDEFCLFKGVSKHLLSWFFHPFY